MTESPFVLTFDFEDWHQLVHRRIGRDDWHAGSPECEEHVERTLELLDELGVRATFFVAGVAAERHPDALREVAARGHEIASHGYEHRRVFRQGPEAFRRDVARGIRVVEEICSVTPVGYRAPWFSINLDTPWAHDVLSELGFRYSSSAFDSPRLPRRIQPVPAEPYEVRPGLREFPVASLRRGRLVLPLGGGAYWRALPAGLLRRGLERVARASTYPVLYFHPYEFAAAPLRVVLPAEASPRERFRETARRLSKNARRRLIADRLREVASRFRFVTFQDVLDDELDTPVLREARTVV